MNIDFSKFINCISNSIGLILFVALLSTGCAKNSLNTSLSETTSFSDFKIKVFTAQVFEQQHPSVSVTVPEGYKVIGGGAYDYWQAGGTGSFGNMLTASYPDPTSNRIWHAAGKDQGVVNKTTFVAFAIAIHDPNDLWEVKVFSQTSTTKSDWPTATVSLPSDYRMTGGGAKDNWTGYGNLLTASVPSENNSWIAHGWWQGQSSPATITSYAIGIKPKDGSPLPYIEITHAQSSSKAAHPQAMVAVKEGYRLTSGGAITTNWTNHHTGANGNYLTFSVPASCHVKTDKLDAPPPTPTPAPNTYCTLPGNDTSGYTYWVAGSKDHEASNPAEIKVYAIGLM